MVRLVEIFGCGHEETVTPPPYEYGERPESPPPPFRSSACQQCLDQQLEEAVSQITAGLQALTLDDPPLSPWSYPENQALVVYDPPGAGQIQEQAAESSHVVTREECLAAGYEFLRYIRSAEALFRRLGDRIEQQLNIQESLIPLPRTSGLEYPMARTPIARSQSPRWYLPEAARARMHNPSPSRPRWYRPEAARPRMPNPSPSRPRWYRAEMARDRVQRPQPYRPEVARDRVQRSRPHRPEVTRARVQSLTIILRDLSISTRRQ